MKLSQLDHARISTEVEEEGGHCLPVSLQGGHQGGQLVGVGGKHDQRVLEGGGKVGLESFALA